MHESLVFSGETGRNSHFRTAGVTWSLISVCTGQCRISVYPVSLQSMPLPRTARALPCVLSHLAPTMLADTAYIRHSLDTLLYF